MRQYIQDSAWTYLVCYHRYIYVHLHRPWKQCTLFSFMVKHNNWSKEINKITEANSQTGLSNQCYFDGGKSIGSIKLQWGWFCLGFFLVYCQAREDKEKGKADCFFKEESKIKKKKIFGKEIEKKKYVFNLQKGWNEKWSNEILLSSFIVTEIICWSSIHWFNCSQITFMAIILFL